MRHQFRDAGGVVDLGHPFGERAEHAAVVDLLEAVAVRFLERDLADEEQHGRAVLLRDMDADAAVAGAGSAGDHGGGGAAGELAVGFGHVDRPGFEPAGDGVDLVADLIEAVEHVEVAFAGHHEDGVDPLGDEGVGQHAPAGPGGLVLLGC